jgi:tRNA 2-thiouridine synthesizing protein A
VTAGSADGAGADRGVDDAILVDARGLRCPWPVLRLARAAREQPAGARIRILADDPAAPREIAALVAERGWSIDGAAEAGGETLIVTR